MDRRATRMRAAMVALLATSSLLVSAPSQADTPPFGLDVPSLPQGAAPRVPYLDFVGQKIRDGAKQVDVRGLQGRPIQLHKVDGGYLLGRETAGSKSDLVFVSSRGTRTLVTQNWMRPRCDDCFRSDVVVDSDGDSVTFNRRTDSAAYRDTLTVSLPALKITRKREFSRAPAFFEHRNGLVLLGLDTRLIRWNPRSNGVTVASSGLGVEAADTTAGQQLRRSDDGGGGQMVEALPPRTRPSWPLDPDSRFAAWSADDQLIAGGIDVYSGAVHGGFAVWRASDGSHPLLVYTEGTLQITWEDSATVLFTASYSDDELWKRQVVRCTLAGACERVGPSDTASSRRALLVVTRRSN